MCRVNIGGVCGERILLDKNGSGGRRKPRRHTSPKGIGASIDRRNILGGVGNSPCKAVRSWAQRVSKDKSAPVYFTSILGAPKISDSNPIGVRIWTKYVTGAGDHCLPEGVVVTSKMSKNKHHFALVCRSDKALELANLGRFFGTQYQNGETGNPIESSQTVAVARRANSETSGREYQVSFASELVEPYGVKLVGGRELVRTEISALEDAHREIRSSEDWLKFASNLRS